MGLPPLPPPGGGARRTDGGAAAPGRLDSINLSRGGVPKHPTPEAAITTDGVEGDRPA